MLRTNGSALEFRDVEALLRQSAPAPLSNERREALREYIFARLGPQEEPGSRLLAALSRQIATPKWIAIPAGAGIAAAILAASKPVFESISRDTSTDGGVIAGPVSVRGIAAQSLREGEIATAQDYASILLQGGRARLDLEPGGSIRLIQDGDVLAFEWRTGSLAFASAGRDVMVNGAGWSALFPGGGTAMLRASGNQGAVVVVEGTIRVTVGSTVCEAGAGFTVLINPGKTCIVIPTQPSAIDGAVAVPVAPDVTAATASPVTDPPAPAPAIVLLKDGGESATPDTAGNGNEGAPADPPGNSGNAPGQSAPPGSSGNAPGQSTPPGNSGNAPGQSTPPGNSGNAPGQSTPPGNSGNAPGQSTPPGNSGNAPGQSTPPGNSGNAPGQSTPPGNGGNAPGQSTPPGNSGNAPGQSTPPGNSGNAPGQSTPPGNSGNAPGQSTPPGNSGNAPGQSTPPGNSGNAPGQSTPPGNSGNATGQSTPPGNSGNAPGQSTPPGNSGNAPGKS